MLLVVCHQCGLADSLRYGSNNVIVVGIVPLHY